MVVDAKCIWIHPKTKDGNRSVERRQQQGYSTSRAILKKETSETPRLPVEGCACFQTNISRQVQKGVQQIGNNRPRKVLLKVNVGDTSLEEELNHCCTHFEM